MADLAAPPRAGLFASGGHENARLAGLAVFSQALDA